jgi:hypothetical protein
LTDSLKTYSNSIFKSEINTIGIENIFHFKLFRIQVVGLDKRDYKTLLKTKDYTT